MWLLEPLSLFVIAISLLAVPVGLYLDRKHGISLTMSLTMVNFIIFMATMLALEYSAGGARAVYQLSFAPNTLFHPTGDTVHSIYTHMFMHGGIVHLFMNMIFFIILGSFLEEKIGVYRFAALYLGAGFISTIFSALAYASMGNIHIHTLGASGAISGVVGAVAVLYPRESISLGFRFRTWPLWMMAMFFLIFESVLIMPGLLGQDLNDGINHFSHLGGFLGGFILAVAMARRVGSDEDGSESAHISSSELKSLEEMAIDDDLRQLYSKIEKEDIKDVRDAWVEHFLKKARCPGCHKPLSVDGTSGRCSCGYRIRIK